MSQSNYYSFQSGDNDPTYNKYQEDSFNNSYNQNSQENNYNYNTQYNSQTYNNTNNSIGRPRTPRQQLQDEIFDKEQKYTGKYPGENSKSSSFKQDDGDKMSEAKMINQREQPSSSRPASQRKIKPPKWQNFRTAAKNVGTKLKPDQAFNNRDEFGNQKLHPDKAYLYMVLPSFYQSHRRFQKNVNFAQLFGQPYNFGSQYDLCLNDNTEKTFRLRYDFPCGLQAQYILNDSILNAQLFLPNEDPNNPERFRGHPIRLNHDRIAWDIDIPWYRPPELYDYSDYPAPVNASGVPQIVTVTNVSNAAFKHRDNTNKTLHEAQNAMVWFRLSSKPDSEKLMEVVEGVNAPQEIIDQYNLNEKIPQNSVIQVTVNNTFPYTKNLRLRSLGDKRNAHFVTQTLSGALYLAIGAIQLIWVMTILILHKLGLWVNDVYSQEAT